MENSIHAFFSSKFTSGTGNIGSPVRICTFAHCVDEVAKMREDGFKTVLVYPLNIKAFCFGDAKLVELRDVHGTNAGANFDVSEPIKRGDEEWLPGCDELAGIAAGAFEIAKDCRFMSIGCIITSRACGDAVKTLASCTQIAFNTLKIEKKCGRISKPKHSILKQYVNSFKRFNINTQAEKTTEFYNTHLARLST